LLLSDWPGNSITRVCADDFGSALTALKTLRTHYSIFNVASQVAGLHLKPSKCVIIVSCVELSDAIVLAIKNWLSEHVPGFLEFSVKPSGKYLGWWLGVDSVNMSYKDPVDKFVHRVEDVVGGKAPAATSICRYNQRGVTVLSYVAQFSLPPSELKPSLPSLDQWAIHKLLRIPFNSLPRNLAHSLTPFSIIEPTPLTAYCMAVHYRFAHSEAEYLRSLCNSIAEKFGNSVTLERYLKYGIPAGGLPTPSVLESLMNALNLCGPYRCVSNICQREPKHLWLSSYPNSAIPAGYSGLQSAAIDVFSYTEKVHCFSQVLAKKATVTLGLEFASSFQMRVSWFQDLERLLQVLPLYLRMCWLKAIAGAWCTSHRLQTQPRLPCIFGCDAKDEIRHYLACPILWQFPREFLDCPEVSVNVQERLCLVNPTGDKIRTLAFVHALYHACKNDPFCFLPDGQVRTSCIVQRRAAELSRNIKHMVMSGG